MATIERILEVKKKWNVEMRILTRGIEHFWEAVDAETCTRYINNLQKVLPKMIEVKADQLVEYLTDC